MPALQLGQYWRSALATHKSLSSLCSQHPHNPPGFLCLSCRWDNADRLLRVRWWPLLFGQAWNHGAGSTGTAISCDTLANPGWYGRCHETFISSENCTYVGLMRTSGWGDSWEGLDMLHCAWIAWLNSLPSIAPNFSNSSFITYRAFKKLNFVWVISLPLSIELVFVALWSTWHSVHKRKEPGICLCICVHVNIYIWTYCSLVIKQCPVHISFQRLRSPWQLSQTLDFSPNL